MRKGAQPDKMVASPKIIDSQIDPAKSIFSLMTSPAFALDVSSPSRIPILIAVPHAGRAYSDALLQELRGGLEIAQRLEDRYVDILAKEVAERTGAGLLVTEVPRAIIDLNRAPDDVDWEMLTKQDRPATMNSMPSRRVRNGLGLIPRRLSGVGELWRRRLSKQSLIERIESVHRPYHNALAAELSSLRDQWGAALLIDLHSMPSLGSVMGSASPQIVLGDRFGASCEESVVALALAHFAEAEREVAHNRPYAGGYVLDRHGDPRSGMHAIQVEMDRARYLDAELNELGEGSAAMIEDLVALVERLAPLVVALGRGCTLYPDALAAE